MYETNDARATKLGPHLTSRGGSDGPIPACQDPGNLFRYHDYSEWWICLAGYFERPGYGRGETNSAVVDLIKSNKNNLKERLHQSKNVNDNFVHIYYYMIELLVTVKIHDQPFRFVEIMN